MSKYFEKIRAYRRKGYYTEAQVRTLARVGAITQQELEQILADGKRKTAAGLAPAACFFAGNHYNGKQKQGAGG